MGAVEEWLMVAVEWLIVIGLCSIFVGYLLYKMSKDE